MFSAAPETRTRTNGFKLFSRDSCIAVVWARWPFWSLPALQLYEPMVVKVVPSRCCWVATPIIPDHQPCWLGLMGLGNPTIYVGYSSSLKSWTSELATIDHPWDLLLCIAQRRKVSEGEKGGGDVLGKYWRVLRHFVPVCMPQDILMLVAFYLHFRKSVHF